SRLREYLNPSKAEPVVFGRKRVLVNTNFANRFLWRQAPIGKTVDENLAAVRSRRWPSQYLQHVGNFLRVVRQALDLGAAQHDRAGVVIGFSAQSSFGSNRYFLLLQRHAQLEVKTCGAPGDDRQIDAFVASKAGRTAAKAVLARRQIRNHV